MGFNPVIKRATTFQSQTWTSGPRLIESYGTRAVLRVTASFDDELKNGHDDFAITATVSRAGVVRASGCLHEDIREVFPELAHLIKWHLCSTKGPLHYVANTVYLAGDRDCWGLRKGEERQIVNGRTGLPSWKLDTKGAPNIIDSATCPPQPEAVYVPWCRVGEGKERQLNAARGAAAWPEATDEQLCLPKEELTALLVARLPKLLEDFKTDMEAFGFQWSPT